MYNVKGLIQQVLDDFFNTNGDDNNRITFINHEDTDLLSQAIFDVLKNKELLTKGVSDEN